MLGIVGIEYIAKTIQEIAMNKDNAIGLTEEAEMGIGMAIKKINSLSSYPEFSSGSFAVTPKIELTREEALSILMDISRLEGYLYSINDSGVIIGTCFNSIELLRKKIGGCE